MPTLLYFHHAHALMRLRVCLVSNFTNFFLSFGPLFYRMELNTMQNFWQKRIHSPFCILASRGKKKKSQKALTHPMKNLAFWMELNTSIKILAFCISSFHWHFAFFISWGTKDVFSSRNFLGLATVALSFVFVN
jgi:hypothetical protein